MIYVFVLNCYVMIVEVYCHELGLLWMNLCVRTLLLSTGTGMPVSNVIVWGALDSSMNVSLLRDRFQCLNNAGYRFGNRISGKLWVVSLPVRRGWHWPCQQIGENKGLTQPCQQVCEKCEMAGGWHGRPCQLTCRVSKFVEGLWNCRIKNDITWVSWLRLRHGLKRWLGEREYCNFDSGEK